jgi:hypothetical protein
MLHLCISLLKYSINQSGTQFLHSPTLEHEQFRIPVPSSLRRFIAHSSVHSSYHSSCPLLSPIRIVPNPVPSSKDVLQHTVPLLQSPAPTARIQIVPTRLPKTSGETQVRLVMEMSATPRCGNCISYTLVASISAYDDCQVTFCYAVYIHGIRVTYFFWIVSYTGVLPTISQN